MNQKARSTHSPKSPLFFNYISYCLVTQMWNLFKWSEEAAKTTAAKYHHFVNKSWFCKLDLWFSLTRGLKITITFTYGRMIDTTYPGIKISISSISFWPEARIRGQQISKELSWTWIRTWPQISGQPADFELIFVILKYELATVGINSWKVWGSC